MQLARRIANGHAYMQKDAAAMKLAPTSMDTQTGRHAEAARQYHAKYGTLYDNRDQDRKLPKAVLTWLRSVRDAANQQPTAPQVRRYLDAECM